MARHTTTHSPLPCTRKAPAQPRACRDLASMKLPVDLRGSRERLSSAPRIPRCVALFNPSGGLAELFGNFPQKLRCALFRLRRHFFFHESLHPRKFFVHALSKIFEIVHTFKPRDFFVDASPEFFESAHGFPSPRAATFGAISVL